MPARIQPVNRIIPAVHIRQLIEIGVPGKEASGCRVVIPRTHLHDPRVPVVAITRVPDGIPVPIVMAEVVTRTAIRLTPP